MADEKKKIEYYGEPTTIAKLLSIIDGVHGYSKGLQDRPYDIDVVLKPFDDWLIHTKDNYSEAEKFKIDKANFKVADAAFITESNVSWTDTNFFKAWRTRHRFVHRIDGVYWSESGSFTATKKFMADNSKYFDEFYPQTMNYQSTLTDGITYDHSIESIVRESWHGYWDSRYNFDNPSSDIFEDKESEWPY